MKAIVNLGLVLCLLLSACVPSPTPPVPFGDFKFESPQSGDIIPANSIISCTGSYSLSAEGKLADMHVWVLLRDGNYQHYYLQNPPVQLLSGGKWKASNIRVSHDISQIVAVQVNQEGNRIFAQKVRNNEFEAFDELPNGSETLATVNIK